MALPVHNFLSHLCFFKVGEIMLLKYGNLMLPAGHILDLNRVWLWSAIPFFENYAKLYFDAKHLKKGLNRGKIFAALFSKKVFFLANVEHCPKVLEYALIRGIFRYSYPWYWFYLRSSSSVLCVSCKNTFVGASNLQMITHKFWFEYLWGPFVLFLDPVLCIALVSSEDEAYNLRSWLHEKELDF